MPHLRNLQVSTRDFSPVEMPPTRTILLAELTCFNLSAECAQIEWFVAGLAAPSLRKFHISVLNDNSGRLHIPHLSKLIRVAGIVFFAARLTISYRTLTTSLLAHPPTDNPPSKIVTIKTLFMRPGSDTGDSVPSAMLAALEDIFLSISDQIKFDACHLDLTYLHKLFEEFCNVKVVRLHHGLETVIVDLFRQLTMNILPSLEEIVVYTTKTPRMPIGEKDRASVLESFGPFTTARHQMGRPVKVYWSTDGEVLRYSESGLYDTRWLL